MKIKSYTDLKPGDVWLGLTFVKAPTGCGFVFSIGGMVTYQMNSEAITALIDAGNDEVERTPEEVVCQSVPYKCGSCGMINIVRTDLVPFIGETVEVTVKVKK